MEYVGTKEMSKKLGVTANTISRWCREKRIEGARQDAPGSPWIIPSTFTIEQLLKKK